MENSENRLALIGESSAQETNQDEDRPPWFELLRDLLSLITSKLLLEDLSAFSNTCKSWQSASDSPLPQYPYLMFENTKTRLFEFYNPFCNAWYQANIPELCDAEIRFFKDDWFIIRKGTHAVFLFNPSTKARIDVPDIPWEDEDEPSRMCFSSTPTSPHRVVFGFASDKNPNLMEVCMHKIGEQGWTVHVYDGQRKSFDLAGCSPVVINGLVYCLGKRGNLGIFDPTNSDPTWSVCVTPRQKRENSERRYMVEDEGNLFSVFLRCDGRKVEVLQLNFEDMRWNDVESLGDKVLFLSIHSSFTKSMRGSGNKVYFPRFFNGLDGMFYSLTTKKFHNTTHSFSKSDYYIEREIKQAIWVNGEHIGSLLRDFKIHCPRHRCIVAGIKQKVLRGKVMETSNLGKKLATTHSFIPWLSFSRKDKKMNIICTVSEKMCNHPQFISELCGKICLACNLDWLVLMDQQSYELCIFNISSMRKVKLPRLPEWGLRGLPYCVLSSRPDDPCCHVVFITTSERESIMMCKPDDNKYTTLDWQVSDPNFSVWGATVLNGNLYCILFPSKTLVCADVSGQTIDSKLRFKQVIRGGLPSPSLEERIFYTEWYLVNVDNELLFISKISLTYGEFLRFKIYRADFSNMAWVELRSIGGHTIFLDPKECVSCLAAEAGTRENCIYFTRCGDRRLYFFDLEDQSIMTSLPCATISKKKVDSKWILNCS